MSSRGLLTIDDYLAVIGVLFPDFFIDLYRAGVFESLLALFSKFFSEPLSFLEFKFGRNFYLSAFFYLVAGDLRFGKGALEFLALSFSSGYDSRAVVVFLGARIWDLCICMSGLLLLDIGPFIAIG